MANMVIPDEGKIKLLNAGLNPDGVTAENYVVDLYQNNYTPVDGSTASDFTAATFTGYAQVSVARSSFPTPTITASVAYTTSSTTPSYSCTAGSQTVYGWYMRGATSGKVYAAQKFDTARVMNAGATESLNPFKFGAQTLH